MKHQKERESIHQTIEKQKRASDTEGYKELCYQRIYLGLDRVATDAYAKDMDAEYDRKSSELRLKYKEQNEKKLTIPEIDAKILIELSELSEEIRKAKANAQEMKILYEASEKYAKSIDTDLFTQNQVGKSF